MLHNKAFQADKVAVSLPGRFVYQSLKLTLAILIVTAHSAVACEQAVVFSEHLIVSDARDYYLVEIRRAHGDNMVGTIARPFGGALSSGETVSIQFTQSHDELADAVCPMQFNVGQTYLLKAGTQGGALQISRFNSHNVADDHERFQVYVHDIIAAQEPVNPG